MLRMLPGYSIFTVVKSTYKTHLHVIQIKFTVIIQQSLKSNALTASCYIKITGQLKNDNGIRYIVISILQTILCDQNSYNCHIWLKSGASASLHSAIHPSICVYMRGLLKNHRTIFMKSANEKF